MDTAPRWYKKLAIIFASAALMVGLIIGGGWLGTHQPLLQGSTPIVGVVALAAMVYGARKKK